MIETAGEMPEVALADSLDHLPAQGPEGFDCLRSACARCYVANIRRDLDPCLIGCPPFRGLGRALANLGRLDRFLHKIGWSRPLELDRLLAGELKHYLGAEEQALSQGRGFATCTSAHVAGLLEALAPNTDDWASLLARLKDIPCLDFPGLRALRQMAVKGPCLARRQEQGGRVIMELVTPGSGRLLAQCQMGLLDAREDVDPQAQSQAQLVWEMVCKMTGP